MKDDSNQDINKEVKQVIVIRRDLKMRRGKEISQGAHAAMIFLGNVIRRLNESGNLPLTEAEALWLAGAFTKITVYVNSEAELVELYDKALALGITANIVTDVGKTEFNSIPTKTALAVGPGWSDTIDLVTGHLPLY